LFRLTDIPVRVSPLLIGKTSTAMQIAYIALALVVLTFDLQWPFIESAAADVTAFLTIASWLGYAIVGVKALARQRRTA
jgi:cardiolipin synthase